MLKTLSLNQLRGIIQITRPKVSIVAASYSLLGAYLSGNGRELLSSTVLRAALVVGLIVAFSFAINDYRDADTDRLNHPERPIPSGRVSYRIARILSLALALTALGIALTLGPLLTIIALFNTVLSTLYSYFLKSTVLIGNTVIAFLNASIVIYGSLAVGRLIPAIWIISLLTFLYSLAQEILFAVGDQEGDAKTGLCTTATYLGTTTSLRLFQLIALSFVVGAIGVWFLGLVPARYLFAMIPCSIFPLVGIVILLSRSVTNSSIHLSIRVIKFVRFFSLLPGILLK
jgi:geranylgeranylglycerol-phosphate geranylgeranyltransferase